MRVPVQAVSENKSEQAASTIPLDPPSAVGGCSVEGSLDQNHYDETKRMNAGGRITLRNVPRCHRIGAHSYLTINFRILQSLLFLILNIFALFAHN